jgi:phosphoribosylanthranilate isomerase
MAPEGLRVAALVVDADDAEIERINTTVAPDFFQLHGKETVKRVADIRALTNRPVIKAFGIARAADIAQVAAYEAVADYFLFDAKAPAGALPGGSGKSFDWQLLSGRTFARPWMLSGGLSALNVAEAVRASGARLVDVSSGVEKTRGEKDGGLIFQFLDTVRGL